MPVIAWFRFCSSVDRSVAVFCSQASLNFVMTACRKDWHSTAIGALLSSGLGAKGALRSCPAGFIVDAGLRWCGVTPSLTEWRISVSKSAKKQSSAKSPLSVRAAMPSHQHAEETKTTKVDAGSKQERVIAMLQSPTGTTIAAIMKATGWQQHSVRGFLAGVVRKRLKLKLTSKKVNGDRIYQIATGTAGTTHQAA
jgi:hypothetical protein